MQGVAVVFCSTRTQTYSLSRHIRKSLRNSTHQLYYTTFASHSHPRLSHTDWMAGASATTSTSAAPVGAAATPPQTAASCPPQPTSRSAAHTRYRQPHSQAQRHCLQPAISRLIGSRSSRSPAATAATRAPIVATRPTWTPHRSSPPPSAVRPQAGAFRGGTTATRGIDNLPSTFGGAVLPSIFSSTWKRSRKVR